MLKNYNPELHIQPFQPHELIFLNLDHPDMDVSFCLFVYVFLVKINKAQINYTQDPEDPGIQNIQTYISGKFIDRIC